MWDYGLELQSQIRSHSALAMYDLDGMVPETKLTRSIAGISNLCKFSWYQWVLHVDTPINWPNNYWVLGQHLGPTADVGSILTSNILKANVKVVCHTLVRHMTPDETKIVGWIKQMSDFDASIIVKLGNTAIEAEFDKSVLTPVYKIYEPHTNVYDGEGTPDLNPDNQVPAVHPEEMTPTSEIGDTYLGSSILLPCGGTLTRGRVTQRKRDKHS
jgi:hypothetical protein